MKYRDSNEKYAVCFNLPAMGAGDIHRDITQITVNGTFNGQPFNKTYRVTGGGTGTVTVDGVPESSSSDYRVIGSEFVDMGTTFVGIKTGLDLGPTTPTCTITLTDSSGASTVTTVSTVSTLLNKIYVNENSGDDNNTGTVSSPVKTIGNALEKLRDVPKGNVILQSDISLTGEVTVGSGISVTVTTDGSGRTVTNGAGRVFNITSGGSLTLGENITLTGTNATGNGGAVYVDGGTFIMEAGSKITGSSAQNGGGVYIDSGTFTMSDTATIQDNTATTHGGGVHIFSGGTFTMNGGTIGGTAQNTAEYGGGVFVSGGTFNMNDGTISGNTVTKSGGGVFVNAGNFTMKGGSIGGSEAGSANSAQYGGGVYVFDGTFTVSGSSLTITGNTAHNVYLPGGKTITIGDGGLTGGTIGVTAEGIGAGRKVKITNTSVDRAGVIFISDYAAYSIAEYDGAVYLSDAETKYVAGADGTETLGLFKDALAAVNASGGTITLLKNIDGTNAVFGTSNNTLITFTGGTETKPIILDLNGKTINRGLGVAQADGSVIRIEGGTLTIKDSSATNPDGTNGIGTITGGNTNDGGGGIHITSNSIGPVPGSLILESGSISDNTANASFGGGVYIGNDCTFTMNGGAIENNKVISNSGGGVYVGSSTFIMTGGNITGNTVTEHGGGVNIGSNGVFTMSNGTISGNTATQNGGGVYVSNSGSFEIGISTAVSSPVVSGNAKADSSPNNVYLDGTILLIDGKLEKTVGPGNIGVSMATTGEKFTYQWDRSGLIDTTFFFSDDTKRTVALSGSELSLNLVRVEGGSCTLNGINVTLSSFWISPYEVTQAEFKSIMTGNTNGIASNPSYFPDNPAAGEVQKRRPADRVRWFEAIVYCNLLSIKEGLTPCYTIKGSTDPADWGVRPDSQIHENYNCWNSVTCDFEADGYRLPTETEWEYAARGGQTGISDSSWNNIYSGSTTLEDVAWYSSNSESKTHEVGKKQANALGLYDMSGNLNEWCWNRKSEGNDSRVMRGGYYSSAEGGCQVTAFDSNWPISQGPDQGFRVVRSIR